MNDLLRDGATLGMIETYLNSHRALYGADDYFLTQALKQVKNMLAPLSEILSNQKIRQLLFSIFLITQLLFIHNQIIDQILSDRDFKKILYNL